MSRVGKNKVIVPDAVKVSFADGVLLASSKAGEGKLPISNLMNIEIDAEGVSVLPNQQTQVARRMWGTTQRNIQNLVTGLSKGFSVNLALEGVGYRASVQGQNLVLQLGYSHDVVFPVPNGITIACEKPTLITISGADKQRVGEIAALIRKKRKPEPYKGKGVIRDNEFVVRKEGKKK